MGKLRPWPSHRAAPVPTPGTPVFRRDFLTLLGRTVCVGDGGWEESSGPESASGRTPECWEAEKEALAGRTPAE